MIIYKCLISGDELFTDVYKINDFHDLIYEVEAKFVTEKAGDVDDSLIGGNKSAEEPDENAGSESACKSGPNVALANRYVETGFGSKKEFRTCISSYLKAIIKHRTEKAEEAGTQFDVNAFKEAHAEAVKNVILPMYDDLQFYTGESLNCDASIPMLRWKTKEGETEETPFFYYFKCGIVCEKV